MRRLLFVPCRCSGLKAISRADALPEQIPVGEAFAAQGEIHIGGGFHGFAGSQHRQQPLAGLRREPWDGLRDCGRFWRVALL